MGGVEQEILGLLTEDLYGPWELAIQVPVARPVLIDAIHRLIDQHLAEWFVRASDSASGVTVSESGDRAPQLTEESTWAAPPLESRQFLLGITEAGRSAYFRGAPPPAND